jgi:hypothetical protein
MEITVHHQNFMLAVRREMGWPSFKPANDCIGWTSGREMEFAVGTEVARIAQMLGKDLVYTGWANSRAKDPTSFTVAYREMLTVDIIDRVVPWAANDEAPIILVSTRGDEYFAIDRRGSLVRIEGKPKNIGKGRKLAMARIKATAASLGDELLANNRIVPTGGEYIAPETPVETIVRFG